VLFRLDADAAALAHLGTTLSPDECERRDRFRFEDLRRRFVVARGMLRAQLAGRLGTDPRDIRFVYGEQGKPRLPDGPGGAPHPLRFNLSHSGGLGLLGVSQGLEIGVDVEAVRPMHDRDALVRRFFSAAEQAEYDSLPEVLRERAFFDGWARKEAFIKGVGRGLSLPLASFDVSLRSDGTDALRHFTAAQCPDGPWSVQGVPVPRTHAAAICVQSPSLRLLERGEEARISR
jgi:4'-phosphopantetheinyl transferase